MGTSFFKGKGPSPITPGNMNLLARAGNAGQYAARGASVGAQKDIGAAQGLNAKGAGGPLKRSAAYPAGPKV